MMIIVNRKRPSGDEGEISMSENPKAKANKVDDTARRAFLHKAAKAGVVTTGSVALMMAAGNKRARAGCTPYQCQSCSAK